MGYTPNIRIKGMSQLRYNFIWDKELRHFAYEPKDQKEVDDIFRTQGRLYKSMYFSVYLDEKVEEPAPKPAAKSKKKTKSQPVAEAVTSE